MAKGLAFVAMALMVFQIVTITDQNGNMNMYSIIQSPYSSQATVTDVNSGNSYVVDGLPTKPVRIDQFGTNSGAAIDYNNPFKSKSNRRNW